MIAARDPQEFVPGGRQQALLHPGPLEALHVPENTLSENFLLHRFEKVSLVDDKLTESWIIRRSPTNKDNNTTEDDGDSLHNIGQGIETDHSLFQSVNGSKSNRRFSDEYELLKSDMKNSSTYNKSPLTIKYDCGKLNCNIDMDYMEEELYIRGNVVIWSQGLVYGEDFDNIRKTICSYSSNFPVKQALWCTFFSDGPLLTNTDTNVKSNHSSDDKIECVCIIDAENIRAFTKNNDDFITALPFKVAKIWNTRYGILLEKDSNENNKNKSNLDFNPTIFSMAHPLDEVYPVAVNHNTLHLMEDPMIQIIYANENPSICMLHDKSNGQHSVYRIRKIKYEEWLETCEKSYRSGVSLPNKLKSCNSFMDFPRGIPMSHFPSPLNSRPNSVTSTKSLHDSRSFSPFASTSRCHTPLISPAISTNVKLQKNSRMQGSLRLDSNTNIPYGNTINDVTNQLSYNEPAICFDYLWSDNIMTQDSLVSEGATKAFLSKDLTGQSYLCYLVPSRLQLSIVKVDLTNINLPYFGMLTSISAKDAVPIEHLCMLAILEHTGNIVLYSGLTMVGKLHLGGVLAQHIPSPFVLRHYQQFSSPFPKRSSLLSCATPSADPKFEDILSPVLPISQNCWNKKVFNPTIQPHMHSGEPIKSQLCSLRDSIYNRLTLQYIDGTYYRVTLPTLASSPLIDRCLNALRQSLHRDATLTLLSRWYSTRNAPGSLDLTNEEEWNMFSKLIFELLGYYDDQVSDIMMENAMTPSTSAKRKRTCNSESDLDWELLLETDVHKNIYGHMNTILQLTKGIASNLNVDHSEQEYQVNTNAILFPFIRIIHYVLHLLYEDMKLNILYKKDLPLIAKLLCRLSFELNLKDYQLYYFNEFPSVCNLTEHKDRCLNLNDGKIPSIPQCFEVQPPSIFNFLLNVIEKKETKPFPIMTHVNETTRNIIEICGLYLMNDKNPNELNENYLMYNIAPVTLKCDFNEKYKERLNKLTGSIQEKIVTLMNDVGLKNSDLDSFPIGVNLLLHNALWLCREEPPIDWNSDTYNLLLRLDLANPAYANDKNKDSTLNKYDQTQIQDIAIKHTDCVVIDGMEGVSNSLLWNLRFPEDLRVIEARRLLQSSKPVAIVLVQRPDVSDHDFIEEQERHLYAICTRTLSLPVGRGMFTMRTANPVITEPLPTPPLCLTGKAPPKGTTVEMTRIDVPANMNFWPLFHNGVANGLRICPEAHNIDTTWITFNRPKNNDSSAEHAGFLMALGLNGHLKNLAALNTFDYLIRRHEMTSLGLLLGLSATFRGTSSISITKMLSVHIEALLPPTSMELDIQQNLQVGALLGIGLVYEGTGHRHMTEILLAEIGRPPGPEMENSVDRESYALAAGLALGLVTLQKGGKQSDIADLNVPDTLHYYMVGGNKRPLTGAQKEKYKVPSFQIREGSCVNLDVTAPGATLALGLMYLRSGNRAVADWMSPPHTPYLLDFVRPDFLMLRTLSRSLILWDEIQPTKDWIEGQVLPSIKPFCMVQPIPSMDIDYEAMNQAYCNIIAGACFAVGLKYAGSTNNDAFQTLLHYCHMFTSLTSKSIAELAGKPTIETCLNFVLLSAAMVMAGTGNLEIMRIVRHLRRRVGVNSSAIVTYGSHLAIHMALGLLFLGGGRYTLSNSPSSVAALVCAFYPKFPTHSNDNRYHLQAFRHLYVLAVEPRLLIPKDVATDQMCYANIKIIQLDGTTIEMKAPCLLPDLNSIHQVKVKDARYWPVTFQKGKNFDKLFKLLNSGCIAVQPRAGCVSYAEDKYGLRSDLANSIKELQAMPWDPHSEDIVLFTADYTIRYFCEQYLDSLKNCGVSEEKLRQILTAVTYDCVVKDKLFLLPILVDLFKVIQDFDYGPDILQLQQFKLISSQVLKNGISSMLISTEIMLSIEQMIRFKLDKWEDQHKDLLQLFVRGEELNLQGDVLHKLCSYTSYYEIPHNLKWDVDNSFSSLLSFINKIPNKALDKIRQIMS